MSSLRQHLSTHQPWPVTFFITNLKIVIAPVFLPLDDTLDSFASGYSQLELARNLIHVLSYAFDTTFGRSKLLAHSSCVEEP